MQYAVLTRDYTNDYRWSWATRGNDFPLAKISQSLKSRIPDGEKGLVVSFDNGKFHILLASLDKLGEKTNGKDSENRTFYVYLVFSCLSQGEVKGLVRYYYQNWENPGKAFADIVRWNDDNKSWELIENKIIKTFNSIPKGTISGKILVQKNVNKNESQKENSEPVDWLDYDLSEENGVKIIMRAGSVKITVDEMPVIDKIVTVDPPNTSRFKALTIICVLLFVALGITMYVAHGYSTKNREQQGKYKALEKNNEKLEKRLTEEESDKIQLLEQKKELENKLVEVEAKWDEDKGILLKYDTLEKKLQTVKQNNEKLEKRLTEEESDKIRLLEQKKGLENKLAEVEAERDKYKGIVDRINKETQPITQGGKTYYLDQGKVKSNAN